MAKLIPPDLNQCQAEKPGPGPFALGGETGDLNNGYRIRCKSKPTVVVKEKKPGPDGKLGSMSLCDDCKEVFANQFDDNLFTFKTIKKELK